MSRGLPKNTSNLLEKAKESALLAVDIYNKPNTAFRSGGFVVLMCIAWTSLLHAIFERDGIKYFYRKNNGRMFQMIDGERKTWELQRCIEEFIQDPNDPTRKNVEFFVGLRNKIEHRFMPEIDTIISGECQAFILNLEEALVKNFGVKNSLIDFLFIPLQFTEKRKEFPKTKSAQKVLKFIEQFRDSISIDISNSQNFSFKAYFVPKLGNHRNSSDIAIEFIKFDPENTEDMEKYNKMVVAIKEKQVPVANQGMYRPKRLLEIIKDKTGQERKVSWHTKMWQKYKIRPVKDSKKPADCQAEYCQWDSASHQKDYVYTDKWINLLIEKEIKNSK